MVKLLTLEGFLNLSAGNVKRIDDFLRPLGLTDEGIEKYDEIDEFLDATESAVDGGDIAILCAENEEYNAVKKSLITRFSLKGEDNGEIRKTITKSRHHSGRIHDIEGHCLMPAGCDIYVTDDGLYSGFCMEFSAGGKFILLPLDEERLDALLEFVKEELTGAPVKAPEEKAEETKEEEEEEDETEEVIEEEAAEETADETLEETEDIAEEDSADIFSGEEENKDDDIFEPFENEIDDDEEDISLQLKNGDIFTIDNSADEADLTGFEEAIAAGAKMVYSLIQTDETVAFVNSENSSYINAMAKKIDGLGDCVLITDAEIDNERDYSLQIALAKKAKKAMQLKETDFGVAISKIFEEDREGEPFYYAYLIVHDGERAKVKKVSTASKTGVENLIPHAFTLMFGIIDEKAEEKAQTNAAVVKDNSKEKKKKVMIMTAVIIGAIIAIGSAIFMVHHYFSSSSLPTTQPSESVSDTQSTQPTQPSVVQIPTETTLGDGVHELTTDNAYAYPGEPTAGTMPAITTLTPIASTQGTFTFTVYGYGHGVGMSQTGANYYASVGKSYLEILSIYYYGTTLVLGDTSPETVLYGGSTYNTRDYLAMATESEMGSSYNMEALKAQVLALSTFAKSFDFNVPTSAHAFNKTPSQQSYDAVDAVMGQYLTYQGEVAKTFFFATSAGKTTSYANAFGDKQIAYLSGGRPSGGDVTAENYMTTVTYSSEELKNLIKSTTGIELTGDPSKWLQIVSHDGAVDSETGYVAFIQVGDQTFTGYKFRMNVMSGALRSHCFKISYTPSF